MSLCLGAVQRKQIKKCEITMVVGPGLTQNFFVGKS